MWRRMTPAPGVGGPAPGEPIAAPTATAPGPNHAQSAPPPAAILPATTPRPTPAENARQVAATGPPTPQEMAAVVELIERLTGNVAAVILGKPQVIRLAVAA